MKNYGAVEEGVPSEITNCFTFSVKIISRFKTRLKHAYPYVNVSSEFLNLHVSHAAGVVVVVVVVVGGGGQGGFTLFYKPDRYVPPPRVWFLGLFCLKKFIHFAHLVWNRVWFSRELRERMNIFIVSVLNK